LLFFKLDLYGTDIVMPAIPLYELLITYKFY